MSIYQYPHTVLQIFCKTPQLGLVKTRLMPALSAEEALAAHLELSRRTLSLATKNCLCPIELWCTPTVDHPFFFEAAQHDSVRLCEQQGRNLGERMHHALISALHDYSSAVLIGTDCPSLTERDLKAAITALDANANVVFAPAEDGGYVLVGLNRPRPELFANMPWGTSAVMEISRARLAAIGQPHVELAVQWDVDIAADFARYRKLGG
jgi:uncharacterized protein